MKSIQKTNSPKILLVTTSTSKHASVLEEELRRRDFPHSRVNTDTIDLNNWPQLRFSKEGIKSISFKDSYDNQKELDDFSAIWLGDIFPSAEQFNGLPYAKWAFLETKKALEWILGSSNAPYINDLNTIIAGSNKVVQLQRASKLGLRIPETIISSDYDTVKDFVLEKTVYKPISRPTPETIGDNRIVLTTLVDEKDVTLDSVSSKLSLFQKYIDKKYEVRIYVIGDEVLSAEIHSQKSKQTKIDWRNYDIANTPHYPHDLPKSVVNACKDLTHSFGLRYSAIDMILTPKNEYVFLELNPQGLWLWLEKLTGIDVTSTLANELICLAENSFSQ